MPYKNPEDARARNRERDKNDPEFRLKKKKWRDDYRKREKEKFGCRRDYDKSREHPEIRIRAKNCRDRARVKALEMYGKVCQCCGENRIEFLAIDHINRDGKKNRKQVATSAKGFFSPTKFFLWAVSEGIPREGFRVLCHNCNFATRYGEEYPHKKQEINTVDSFLVKILGDFNREEVEKLLSRGCSLEEISQETGASLVAIRSIYREMSAVKNDSKVNVSILGKLS